MQHAEDFRLRGEAQVADLIEEQGAAVGRFEFSDAPIDAGGDAFFDAKKFGFYQVFRQCRAVESDEGMTCARGLLKCSALAISSLPVPLSP